MDSQKMGASLQGKGMEDGGSVEGLIGSNIQEAVDHRLSRKSYEERTVWKQANEFAEVMKESIVLFKGLAKAKARVEDDVSDAKGIELSKAFGKKAGYGGKEGG